MGLTTWENAPGGPVRKTDVVIAKNYLEKEEIEALNLIVSAYLDFAELQARNRRPMHRADWITKLDDFLRLSEHEVLKHGETISHEDAEELAHGKFAKYDDGRRLLGDGQGMSDFDRAVEEIGKLAPEKKRGQRS